MPPADGAELGPEGQQQGPEDPSSQVPGRLQTDDSSLLTPIFIRSGAPLGCKLVKTVDTVTSWSQVGLQTRMSVLSCSPSLVRTRDGRAQVASRSSVITSRSGVVHKSITMVVPWSGVLRLEFHADRHTTDMRGLPPSHVSHKSLS